MSADLYRLADLESRDLLDRGHAKPARLAVIGWPVAHSRSPGMHQAALDEAGIDARYVKIEVEPGQVPQTLRRMQALGFIGCNVTVPHKFDALAACDALTPEAREMGAVNTVKFTAEGLQGFNTDGYGFEQAVRETLGFSLAGASVLIVGAGGGAGGAIAVHCARQKVARLVLVNRSFGKIADLARQLTDRHPGIQILAIGTEDSRLTDIAREAGLLVNTTSLGLKADDPSPLSIESFTASQVVYDTVYRPGTAFRGLAEAAGARHAGGESMLLHQGAEAFRLWFPGYQPDPLAAMRHGLCGTGTGTGS